jgi:hypothetical protein
VTIVVRSGTANVADGTSVSISTNLGTISPTTATTTGGGVLAVYNAPASSGGTATITAISGGRTSTTSISVTCAAAATATTAPAAPAPTTSVRPPSTGDAGIAEGVPGWRTYAGIVLISGSVLGAFAVVRKRAQG